MAQEPPNPDDSFLDKVRKLAEDEREPASIDPSPSAELITSVAQYAFKFAREEKAIPRGQVGLYKRRAADLREDAIRITEQYRGADLSLSIILAPELATVVEANPAAVRLLMRVNLKRYQKKRVEIAREAVALWDELQSKREKKGRGRPRGSISYPEQDFEIHIAATKCRMTDGPERGTLLPYEKYLREIVQQYVKEGKLERRGDNSVSETIDTHVKRLKANGVWFSQFSSEPEK